MSKIHIGTMGWSYAFWVGTLYHKGVASGDFLAEYSRYFQTVEVDNTFYRIPSNEVVAKWRDETPSGFLFSLKFPQVITHKKMLRNCEEETSVFIERVSQLQGKLGLLLLQLPYDFRPEHLSMLRNFLPTLPKTYRYAVEVRNRKVLNEDLYSLLKENEVALTLVDHPFMPKMDIVTTNFTYVRWEGDRRKVKGILGRVEVDRREKIHEWAEKIAEFSDNGLEVFGYFSKYFSGYPPGDAERLLDILGTA
jgi:uncharacterized protein YecE (DUF72 family)